MILRGLALAFLLVLAPLLLARGPKDSGGAMETEKCQKPQWDPRFIFEQDQVFYDVNEEVMMKCPEGYWSSATEIKCMKLNPRQGSTTSRSIWLVKNVTGLWHPVEGNMTCVELQPYENLDNYCVIKETLLGEEDAGKGGLAGKPLPQPVPVLESSWDSQRREKMERMFKVQC
ncbi:hypothetical protein AV530_019842 [Patagioenas fasciata monilis]|uniref:Sushi domain-containing protein n=1 Tax=Patagioenas fasciata monilis TaxID=372326 RepID=A0A1V4JT93_PATFA|nr:hypothetical protein AV530_019842 [Patagioenas fasciata monilis]